jgi:hypothetical protein
MGEIDIAAGDVVEEVLHGIDAELMVKQGAAFPHPFKVADIALQFQRHRIRPPFRGVLGYEFIIPGGG